MSKSVKISILLGIAFVVLIRLRPVWERYPGGLWNLIYFGAIGILFICILFKILTEIIRFFKNRENQKTASIISIGFLVVGLVDGVYNPLEINLENIYGNVTFRACYEGTQNQATFKLREENKFEIHWTGIFFYDEFHKGTYSKIGDTLFLDYNGNRPIRFGDKALMDNKNKNIRTIRTHDDSLKHVVPFYFGYCKGLN